jgi:hypothetical protein
MIGAIYDRDYFCAEQIDLVKDELSESLKLAWVFERKEIENYLLVPVALDRAIRRALSAKGDDKTAAKIKNINSRELLEHIISTKKNDIFSQLMGKKHDYLGKSGIDRSDIYKDAIANLEDIWSTFDGKIRLAPGKDVLREFRERTQIDFEVTLTESRIVESMQVGDIPDDIKAIVKAMDSFRTTP